MPYSLSLRELVDDCYKSNHHKYLSLKITSINGYTQIRLTTTDSEPVSYSSYISPIMRNDILTLIFVLEDECVL